MREITLTEAVLRRDRLIVAGGLGVICLLSWLWVFSGAGTGMSAAGTTTWRFPPVSNIGRLPMDWALAYWLVMLAMWWVMMIAMMVPSAAPMVLLYARVCRHNRSTGGIEQALVPTAAFVGGYIVAWLGFSVVATTVQWAFEALGLLDAMVMWSTERWLSAALLFGAGLYQLSPLKNICLKHCQSPVAFLSKNWRKGRSGALLMGLHHGLYCIGCCWFLMALLFAGGIMNLVWIAGLAVFVLVEKLAPLGQWTARISGVVFIAGGIAVLVSGGLA